MKKFLIGFFAIVGVIVVVITVAIISFASVQKDRKAKDLPARMVLTLDLDGGLKEANAQPSVLDSLSDPVPTLQDILLTLELARQDSRVNGIAVHIDQGGYGVAQVQELREAISRFRRSGKFAYIYSDTLGGSPAMGEYWLATAFDQIWLQPMGELAITGFSAEIPFAKDFLDKIGVQPELLHEGKYKSFPESLTRSSISAENREMTESLLNNLQEQFEADIATTRHIDKTKLLGLMDQAPMIAEEALSSGLIDAIGYHDEFDNYLEQKTNGAQPIEFANYQANGPRAIPGDKIALINVLGALTNVAKEQARSGDVVSADDVGNAIEDAGNTPSIKAIVVRVDSPGGTPLAADMIRRSIEIAKSRKPVIISMGNTAASGGYWMSVDANSIIAQPGTLTGSIGVFGGKPNLQGLWNKIGIHWDSVGNADNNSLWSANQPFSTKAREKIALSMHRTYEQFIAKVSNGRNMKADKVQEIAQGRVWTGSQAVKNGLVDKLGGLDVAIIVAKDLAKIPTNRPVNLEVFPKPLNPLKQLIQMLKQGAPFHLLGAAISDNLSQAFERSLLISTPTIR